MHPFEKQLALAWPLGEWRDLTVLVAVSGGSDSVALLRGLAALRAADSGASGAGALRAAHLNHQLRGEDAREDERFVVALCRHLAIPCEVGRASLATFRRLPGGGLEAAARKARYRFLASAAGACGARYVAVAHTADDQAETILHRILRGTGIGGLSGMARARPLGGGTLLRPLLGFRRAEVLEYLADIGQSYRIDSTNVDTRFTRNRLRHDLLPRLARDYNPNVTDALLRLGALAGEVRQWMDWQVEALQAACCGHEEGAEETVTVQTRRLRSEPAALVRELLVALWRQQNWPMRQMGFDQWNLLAEMVHMSGEPSSPRRKHVFPGSILVEAGPEGLVLRSTSDE